MGGAIRRRAVLTGLPALAAPLIGRARAQGALPTVRIGLLWDRSGVGAITSGLDQVVAARLAVEDFGQFSRGYPIDLVDKEFERRPDQAAEIARGWFERDNVAVILDIPGTAAPVVVQDIARSHNRSVMNTGSFNSALIGASCSPTASHWLEDSRALTRAMSIGLAAEGAKSWFLVATDDVTGLAFQADAVAAIESTGGRVLGMAQHPAEPNAATFALTRARDSGADAIGLCTAGGALEAQIKEARALGLLDRATAVCAYALGIRQAHVLGPRVAGGLWTVTGFYWNQNDRTRSFSQRFIDVTERMPDKPYAATYAAIGHFLRVVEITDTIEGVALNIGFRRESVYFYGTSGQLRFDGGLLLDVGLYRVKRSEDVSIAWDYYKPVRVIAAADVFRPPARGGCALRP